MSAGERTGPVGERVRQAAATVRAPASLRAAVAAERLRRRGPSRGRAARRALVGALAAALIAAVALVLLALPEGSGAPTVVDAARVSLRAPTARAPAEHADGYLALGVDGVRFPAASRAAGWRPVGVRADRLGERGARTVTYARAAQRIGYTIVAGAPLPVPGDARRARYGEAEARVLRRDGLVIVTWRRGAVTCVLAGRGVTAETLLELAQRS